MYKRQVNGISYVIAENFATENIPADFSETTVNYQGADYRGVSYDKGSVVMLYLVQDGAEESTGSFFVYDSTRDTPVSYTHLDVYKRQE